MALIRLFHSNHAVYSWSFFVFENSVFFLRVFCLLEAWVIVIPWWDLTNMRLLFTTFPKKCLTRSFAKSFNQWKFSSLIISMEADDGIQNINERHVLLWPNTYFFIFLNAIFLNKWPNRVCCKKDQLFAYTCL